MFLSRLRGGLQFHVAITSALAFLSRLRGGLLASLF